MFIDKLNAVLKYGAKEANEVETPGTPVHEYLSELAAQIAKGEEGALYPLGDKLQDFDHPLAPFINRIIEQKITPESYNDERMYRNSAHTLPDLEQPLLQPWYPMREHISPDFKLYNLGKTGYISSNYYNHPTGHYLGISFFSREPETLNTPPRFHDPIYLVPTTPDEIKELAAKYKEMGHEKYADHLLRTLAVKHG